MATDPAPASDHDPRQAHVAGDEDEDAIPFHDPKDRSRGQSAAEDYVPQRDQMAPPDEPCECYCLHCGRTFMSDKMWFQRVVGDPDGFEGFWMCATPNCSGAGFTFDIFPTDPDHPANEGWHYFDDDEEEGEWSEDAEEGAAGNKDYDPDEKKWKALDAELEGAEPPDEDLEGEEWKYGLEPGERPETKMSPEARRQWEDAQREWEEEQKQYDEPDRRPRELDWSDHESRRRNPGSQRTDGGDPGGSFSEDDIPF
jgi:hypothetical protein